MVKFRFSIVLLCVILPPLLYTLSIQFLEHYAEGQIYDRIKATYLGDTKLLFNGSIGLRKAIRDNLNNCLENSLWIKWGGKASATVQTRRNTLLYPLIDDEQNMDPPYSSTMSIEIATENYRLLNDGVELALSFKLPHNTLISNTVLGMLIFLSMCILLFYFRHWNAAYQEETSRRTAELERLSQTEKKYRNELNKLQQDHLGMANNIASLKAELKNERIKADLNEDEMLEEVIALEDQIARKEEVQNSQNQLIEELQTKLHNLETLHQKMDRRKQKDIEIARKRLKTLYKNIEMHNRAISGYIDLTEDLKLKCEELIAQLNDDPSLIQIKRKVFNKNNRITVLEVVFSYKGRLYFIPKGEKQSELLAIGTKNSQQQDLAYLEKL